MKSKTEYFVFDDEDNPVGYHYTYDVDAAIKEAIDKIKMKSVFGIVTTESERMARFTDVLKILEAI
jgi:hypothetical protein